MLIGTSLFKGQRIFFSEIEKERESQSVSQSVSKKFVEYKKCGMFIFTMHKEQALDCPQSKHTDPIKILVQ